MRNEQPTRPGSRRTDVRKKSLSDGPNWTFGDYEKALVLSEALLSGYARGRGLPVDDVLLRLSERPLASLLCAASRSADRDTTYTR